MFWIQSSTRLDEDGFLTIVDRLFRFSKNAGEMVPHGRIEEALQDIMGGERCAITGLVDEARGEKLVALYEGNSRDPKTIYAALQKSELPKLWLPRLDNIHPVDEVPVLGTGKLDLRALKELAQKMSGSRG